MNRHVLKGGQVLKAVHGQDFCRGEFCAIHNPSNHHMIDWDQNFSADTGRMERICGHGIGHPDPDDHLIGLETIHGREAVHHCDGCCLNPLEGLSDEDIIADLQNMAKDFE